MHGSFTPDSAEKFLELMREAGYETSALPDSDGLQTFSELGINPGATQGDVWSGNVADFGEVRGEYIENYDYTRCVRPNGTAYGTGGTCRQGTPEGKQEHVALSQLKQMLPKGEKIVTSSGGVFGEEPKVSSKSSGEIATAPVPPKPIKDPVPGILRSQAEVKGIIADRPETPNAIRDEMGRPLKLSSDRLKALSQEDLEKEWNRAKTTSRKATLRKEIDRRESEGKLAKLKSDLLETSNKIDNIVKGGGKVGLKDPLSKTLKEQAAAIRDLKKTMNFSEGETYDFTRCVRPDGSAYGTRGKCKKGTETGAKQEAPAKGLRRKPATPQEARDTWAKAEAAVKKAKSEFKLAMKEVGNSKTHEATKKRDAAYNKLERAEMALVKAQDRYFSAAKRQGKVEEGAGVTAMRQRAKANVKEIESEIKTRGPHTQEEKAYLAKQLRMARNRLDRFETGKMIT